MFKFKWCLLFIFFLDYFTRTVVSVNEDALSELRLFHESSISRKGFGVRQELDEDLCQLQNNLTSNALLILDASGKLPAGILTGNMNHFGQYEQCLSVDETVDDVNIKGKYCMMIVTVSVDGDTDILDLPEMTMSGLFGVCVANACESMLIQEGFAGINMSAEELYCREANDKPMAVQDIVAIVLFSVLGMLLILSTGYHLTRKILFNEDVSKIAKSFSVHHNMSRLTYIPKSGNPLSCINGIRALSMVWVVVGHTYSTRPTSAMENPLDLLAWLTSIGATAITAAPLAVDTFFYLAAFLVTWSVLKKFKGPVPFSKSVPLLYLNRYLRLTPAMAAVMLLQVSFFNHVSDGPDWRPVISVMDDCLENWWINLLYLQNYSFLPSTGPMCLGHSWYLAVDMQLYLASPILIVFLFLTMKYAIASLAVVSVASLSAALGYCFYYNFGIMFNFEGNELFMYRYYVNTIPRSPPFVLGIVVAYVIFTLKKRNVTITGKPYMVFHWIITAVLLILPVYGTYTTIRYSHSQAAINFFNAWHRPAWALGVGGIIVASMFGFGGPIGWFLSLDMWIVPARLSYSMYLIHYSIIFSILGSQQSPGRFSDSAMLFRFLSDLSLTILGALLLYVVVEAPFAELSNLLFAKLSGKKEDNHNKLTSKEKEVPPSTLEDGTKQSGESVTQLEIVNGNPTEFSQFNNDYIVSTAHTDSIKDTHGRS